METQEEIDRKRGQLEAIGHQFQVANDRYQSPVQDYHFGDVLVRESWHPALKKYIITVDGAVTQVEAEQAVEKMLQTSPLPPLPPPSEPPAPEKPAA